MKGTSKDIVVDKYEEIVSSDGSFLRITLAVKYGAHDVNILFSDQRSNLFFVFSYPIRLHFNSKLGSGVAQHVLIQL